MKKLLKSLRSRLCDAMRVLFCGRYFVCCADRYISDKYLLYKVAITALKSYVSLIYADDASTEARLDMLITVLDTDNSVVLVYKEHGQCLVSYDCQSQADFDELISQEVL